MFYLRCNVLEHGLLLLLSAQRIRFKGIEIMLFSVAWGLDRFGRLSDNPVAIANIDWLEVRLNPHGLF